MSYLHGTHITLRAIEPGDLDALYRWENDTTLWAYGSSIAPLSRHLLAQYIDNYTADITRDNQLRLMIVERESGETIGTIDCFEYDVVNRKAGVGILIDPVYQHRGRGREALETFIAYAFQFLRLHQLYAHVPASNTPSVKLFQACGFQECGQLHDWVHLPHGYDDALVFQKINRE